MYVTAMFRLYWEQDKALKELGQEKEQQKRGAERKFCFAPLCVSCTPKHLKIKTETLAQPYK